MPLPPDPFATNQIFVGDHRVRDASELPNGVTVEYHDRSAGNRVTFAPNHTWRGLVVDLKSATECTVEVGAIRVNFGGVRISFVLNSGRCSSGVSVKLGDGSVFNGSTHIIGPLTPGLAVSIGRNCLFASGVSVRGSSHHGLWDIETGTLLNREAGIEIGDHVWVGDQVLILNKARIASGSVVGARSIVNKSFDEENVLLVGAPAAIRRRRIDWTNEFPRDNGAIPRS